MKKINIITCSILSLVFSVSFGGQALKPKAHYGEVGRRVAAMVARHHVLNKPFNDEISQKAWTNLVTFYDVDHSIFLKSDLESLALHEFTIDDEIKSGNVDFGYQIHALYSKRLAERVAFVTNFIANSNWDFSQSEVYRLDRKDAQWPSTIEEAQEIWRKRIKNEYLAMTLVRELEAEEKSQNKKEEKESSSEEKKNPDDDFKEPELTVAETLKKKYLQYHRVMTEPDEENILQYYLSAVCRAYDPHTDYLSPMNEEDFEMGMNLKLCGVGAVLQMDDGALKITEVMPGGPMDVDGRIKKGDKIISVKQENGDWEDIMWQPMNKTVRKIRGKKGTRVSLEIIPRSDVSGATRKKIELVRDEIKLDEQAATGHVERVSTAMGDVKLGYVYLPSFYGTMDKDPNDEGYLSCALDVAKYLAEFNAEEVSGLILDMRGNGGGSLKEAVMLSSLFSPANSVVIIKDKSHTIPLDIPRGNPIAFKKPVVVLIDRASASAAEIVAGFLKDSGRAIVLGDVRTHGKGTVQSLMDLVRKGDAEQFGAIKVTTARFYRINGDSTQVKGVESDIHLPSVLDHLDIGEDKLPNALPFTKLNLTNYRRVWNLNAYIDTLRKKSESRTSSDVKFKKHIAEVNVAEEIFKRKEVSLERETRKKMMKRDRLINNDNNDEEEASPRSKRKGKDKDKDVVLKEAYNVLTDLIELTQGKEIPDQNVNWMDVLLNTL